MPSNARHRAHEVRRNLSRVDNYEHYEPMSKELVKLKIWYDYFYINSVDVIINDSAGHKVFDYHWFPDTTWPDMTTSQKIDFSSNLVLAWSLWISDFQRSTRASFSEYPFTESVCRDLIKQIKMEDIF
jgi:hypothetical protein